MAYSWSSRIYARPARSFWGGAWMWVSYRSSRAARIVRPGRGRTSTSWGASSSATLTATAGACNRYPPVTRDRKESRHGQSNFGAHDVAGRVHRRAERRPGASFGRGRYAALRLVFERRHRLCRAQWRHDVQGPVPGRTDATRGVLLDRGYRDGTEDVRHHQ